MAGKPAATETGGGRLILSIFSGGARCDIHVVITIPSCRFILASWLFIYRGDERLDQDTTAASNHTHFACGILHYLLIIIGRRAAF